MGDRLGEAIMLGTWFKEYADLGHWFDKAHGKCVNCGTPAINLYEDGAYGDIRRCSAPQQGADHEQR